MHMHVTKRIPAIAAVALLVGSLALAQQKGSQPPMSFFVTSTPVGNGANLGGLAGADQHCQTLAAAAASVWQC